MRTRWPDTRPTPRLAVHDVAVSAAAALAAAALAGCGSLAAPGGSAAPGAASATASAGGALSGGTGSAGPGRAGPGGNGAGLAGSSSAGPSGSAEPGAACTAATLGIRLDTAAAGVAAGTDYVPLEFTNTSSQPCELTGFPAVALTSGVTGQQIGTEAAVDRSVPATAVLLKPGGVAHAWLGIADVANLPAQACRPITAAGFRVVVPGSESASYLAHRVPACKEPAQGAGILVVHPVQPGAAQRGTA
jgi:Protein of unknown function (DUF4232)